MSLPNKVANFLFSDYHINKIVRLDEQHSALELHSGWRIAEMGVRELSILTEHHDPKVRKTAKYHGDGMIGYFIEVDGCLAAVAYYATYGRFESNSVLQVESNEAALVELITVPEMRGKGIAPVLISQSAHKLFDAGLVRLHSWLWWSNKASQIAFEKAGWSVIGIRLNLKGQFSDRVFSITLPHW